MNISATLFHGRCNFARLKLSYFLKQNKFIYYILAFNFDDLSQHFYFSKRISYRNQNDLRPQIPFIFHLWKKKLQYYYIVLILLSDLTIRNDLAVRKSSVLNTFLYRPEDFFSFVLATVGNLPIISSAKSAQLKSKPV